MHEWYDMSRSRKPVRDHGLVNRLVTVFGEGVFVEDGTNCKLLIRINTDWWEIIIYQYHSNEHENLYLCKLSYSLIHTVSVWWPQSSSFNHWKPGLVCLAVMRLPLSCDLNLSFTSLSRTHKVLEELANVPACTQRTEYWLLWPSLLPLGSNHFISFEM